MDYSTQNEFVIFLAGTTRSELRLSVDHLLEKRESEN